MSRRVAILGLALVSVAVLAQPPGAGKPSAAAAAPAGTPAARPAPPQPDWQIVYTRQPRANKPVPGTPVKEAANWQHASDVGRINGGLAEADVVIDDLKGHVKVIHNCTTAKAICVAQEARVSPDGTRIVYSVGAGNELTEVEFGGVRLGIYEIPGLTEATLWIYDLTTGKSAPIPGHPARAIDRQPEWLNNEKIVFASNRGNTYPFKNPFGMHQGVDQFGRGRCFNEPYCVSQDYGYGLEGRSMQLWTMNIDGTDARNITPHESNALAPAVMSNGDILYSCWNAHENRNYDASTSNSNNPGTSQNKWWLCRTDGNGADSTVILNAHKSSTLKTQEWLPPSVTGGEGRSQLRAIRSVAEIFNGKLAISNYYRSNHLGSMGIIYGMDYRDPHVEGCSTARCYPDGESNSGAGQRPLRQLAAGDYAPWHRPGYRGAPGRSRLAHGQGGPCGATAQYRNRVHDHPRPRHLLRGHAAGAGQPGVPRGEPTCQSIYRVKVPMVTDPSIRSRWN
ncbi:MAG: hypothetical protein R3E50_02135 [Halioglobus sp.]